MLLTRDCVALEAHGAKRVLRFADGSAIAAHAVVLATGVSYRSLGVAGVDDLTGRGVYYGSAMTEAAECADQKVFIVGGANSAGQAAVFFARYASSVHLLVRGAVAGGLDVALPHRAARRHRERHVHTCTTVAEAHGSDHLEEVTLLDADTGERTTLPGQPPVRLHRRRAAHRLARRRPWSATSGASSRPARACSRTAAGRTGWPLDRDPYFLESSLPGVFVAGDVRGGVGEAGRLGRRRGRDGGDPRAPVPGGAMTTHRRRG